jgi:molecular chaperone GrpE (heat shock protein)
VFRRIGVPLGIAHEVNELPSLLFNEEARPLSEPNPMQIVARQGKQILKLNATYNELAKQIGEQNSRLDEASDENQVLRRRVQQSAETLIHLVDALEWTQEVLQKRNDPLAPEVESALRDGLRRLANLGISEIPTSGKFDGNLHEGVGTVPITDQTPAYNVVSVVRRGYQMGPDILRRAEVITTTP